MADLNEILMQLDKDHLIKPPKVFSKSTLSNESKKLLFDYQVNHVVKLINIILEYHIAIDNSDTGTGKSYNAGVVAKETGKTPVVICPKSMIYVWAKLFHTMGMEYYDIVNYETLRMAKTYTNLKCEKRCESPYLKKITPNKRDNQQYHYEWDLPEDAILIVDEAHRCKDPDSENGHLLYSTKQLIRKKIPVLLLSATICNKFQDIKLFFYLLDLIPDYKSFNHYIKLIKYKYKKLIKETPDKSQVISMMIHQEISKHTSRISISELGNKFPRNQIICQKFTTENTKDIISKYDELSKLITKLDKKKDKDDPILVKMLRLRQEIELLKLPIFIELANSLLSEGKSVIIFVNYLKSLHYLAEHLNIKCKIHGKQNCDERNEMIELFQSNKEKIIVSQMRAGGIGISLHDVHGNHPRRVLLNYPVSATDLIQVVGRAPRSNAKTEVIQTIVFAANIPYEHKIMKNLERGLSNISAINDGDLEIYTNKINHLD